MSSKVAAALATPLLDDPPFVSFVEAETVLELGVVASPDFSGVALESFMGRAKKLRRNNQCCHRHAN